MTLQEAQPVGSPIVERVKNILLTPKQEWVKIDIEAATTNSLFKSYAVFLAAIGPVCGAIGAILFGWGALGVVYRPPILNVIVNAVVSYVLALASVFVLGLIIEALAPTFGGVKNRTAAMKVAVYSSTASWLVGVFGLLPALAPLAILGLYSLYLLYTGLPRLMKAPQDKALPYTAVVIVIAIVIALVVGAVLIPLRTLGAAGPYG